MYNLEILEKGCEELGITLSDTQKNQFIRFYEYLVEKNKVMNLTGITEFDEVLVKHFLDSLCCVKAVDMGKIKTVIRPLPHWRPVRSPLLPHGVLHHGKPLLPGLHRRKPPTSPEPRPLSSHVW